MLLDSSKLTPCQNSSSGIRTIQLLQNALQAFEKTSYNCEWDCTLESFEVSWFSYHKNKFSIIDPNNYKNANGTGKVQVVFEYKNTFIEEEMELLFYDDNNFLATTGGFLGLAFGFSCLNCLKYLLQSIEKFSVSKNRD